MNDETAKAFKEFQEDWDANDEHAKLAKKDEERGVRSLEMIDRALRNASKNATDILGKVQIETDKLRTISKEISDSMAQITHSNNEVISHGGSMMLWWEKQNELIHKQMLMMASMGFKLDLD
jgi:hypothetical protein